MKINDLDLYSMDEAIKIAMAELGWSEKQARREIIQAMASGELPYVEPPQTERQQ